MTGPDGTKPGPWSDAGIALKLIPGVAHTPIPGVAHTILTRDQAQALHRLLVGAGVRLPDDLEAVLPPLDPLPDDDGRVAVTLRIPRRHMEYLTQRARQHGEPVPRHIETILREFRAHHDQRRPDHQAPPAEPGMPVMTRRGPTA